MPVETAIARDDYTALLRRGSSTHLPLQAGEVAEIGPRDLTLWMVVRFTIELGLVMFCLGVIVTCFWAVSL